MQKARYRTYTAIGYPESLSEDWVSKLESTHIPILISPLHSPDEECLKDHFHIMLDYGGPHAPEDAEEVFKEIGAVIQRDKYGRIKHVDDKRGMARYFCHLDERKKGSDKPIYDIADVTELSGFDYLTLINLPADKYSAISEMIDFVQMYEIYSFSQLLIYSKENNDTWYRSLCDNSAFIMKEFIKSYFWEQKSLAKNN